MNSTFSSLYHDSDFKLQELLQKFNDNVKEITELATTIEIREGIIFQKIYLVMLMLLLLQGELQYKGAELAKVEEVRDKAKGSTTIIILL